MQHDFLADPQALHLFFTEDIFLVLEPEAPAGRAAEQVVPVAAPNPQPDSDIATAVSGAVEPIPAKVLEFEYLGSNKRNVLILVNSSSEQVSNENGRELLRKIVKSINLTAADFALLNYAKYPESSFTELATYFKPQIIFVFGVSCGQLGLSGHTEYAVVNEGSVKLIFSAGLELLDDDVQAKKTLWAALKQLGL